ncbi:PEP-CTERM sorting domain-containing protein [Nostoc sp. CHAB 5844]|nr:PEP-CTERM sorting domain-containing protein [Nostoc sp. CHAB 5844]
MTRTAIFKNLAMAAAGATFIVAGSVTSAQAITIGGIDYTLGGQIFATGGEVEAEILPGNPNAIFTSELRLFDSFDPNSEFTVVGTNRDIGRTVNLGSFEAGQELLFGIFVRNTQQTYFLGPASRNPDNFTHAGVATIAPGVINGTFEDLFRGGDRSYNDLQFQLRGAVSNNPPPVPEPTTMLGLLFAGGFGTYAKSKFSKNASDSKNS